MLRLLAFMHPRILFLANVKDKNVMQVLIGGGGDGDVDGDRIRNGGRGGG